MWEVINFFALLALPSLLIKLHRWWSGEAQEDKSQKVYYRSTAFDRWVKYTLFALASVYAYKAIYQSFDDFFTTLDLDYNAPNYHLRNGWGTYKANLKRDYSEEELNKFDLDNLDEEEEEIKHLSKQWSHLSRLQKLDWLYERLRVTFNRSLYLLFGHYTFVHCDWCKEEDDYRLFYMSHKGKDYLYAFTILFVSTLAKSKQGWRSVGCWVLLSALAMEASLFVVGGDYRKEMIQIFLGPPPVDPLAALFDEPTKEHLYPVASYLDLGRYLLFTLLFAVMAQWNKGNEVSMQARLFGLLGDHALNMKQHHKAHLLRRAAMSDKDSRQQYLAYHAGRELEEERVQKDPELKHLKEQLLKDGLDLSSSGDLMESETLDQQ